MTREQSRLKHVQVREYVRNLIAGLEPGDPAPSERELVEKFKVARMTARHAMDTLVSQGMLERIPGRGTFVAKPSVDMQARLSSYTEEMQRRNRKAGSTTLVRRQEQAGPGVARALDIAEGAGVLHWRRLRTGNNEPICISDSYIPLDVFPTAATEPEPASLFDWFATKGKLPTWGEDSINADLATTDECALLHAVSGSPVLRMSRRSFCHDVAVEVSRSVFKADQFTLWVPVRRPGG